MGKFSLYVRKHPYFPMEMPITLSVDKKSRVSSAFSTGKKKKTGLIHSYPQLLTVIPRSLWKTFKPCPRGQIEIDKVGITVEKGWALWKKEDLLHSFLKTACV